MRQTSYYPLTQRDHHYPLGSLHSDDHLEGSTFTLPSPFNLSRHRLKPQDESILIEDLFTPAGAPSESQ